MTQRAQQLHATADGQIAELIGLLSTLDEATLALPCPGREKLGDGTVGASARHTADNYLRIATFIQTSDRTSRGHQPRQHGTDRIPGFLRALARGPATGARHDRVAGQHDDPYTAGSVDPDLVVEQLSAARARLGAIAELTDSQLDAIPPEGSFRFCDGQRTLEQVLASLLKHQCHQLEALKTAIG